MYIHIFVLIHYVVMARFEKGNYPGVEDDDWLMGAEDDSPDLNIAALTHAQTRIRYLLYILYILFGLC